MFDRLEIFVSYSHKDETLREELGNHLAVLKKEKTLIWHDRKILAGDVWASLIDEHLNSAQIILLLISSDFLASRYCSEIEFQRAMERHDAQEAVVIPILLRDVVWEKEEFARLQALPRDNKPVTSDYWKGNRDAAFRQIAEGIYNVVEKLQATFSVTRTNIRSLDKNIIDNDKIYNAMLTLNYTQQMRLFRQFVKSEYTVGAFLIHGGPECGQTWLLHRAMKQIPGSTKCNVFSFNFRRLGRGRYLEALWRDLGERTGKKECHSSEKVVEQIHTLWQTQSLALVFRNLNVLDAEYLHKFFHDFWTPLVEKTQSVPGTGQHYLLLFLIDEDNYSNVWDLSFTSHIDSSWQPHIPVRLEKVSLLPKHVLDNWIEHEADSLPTNLSGQHMLEQSEGGLPELVFAEICSQCGYDWYEREKVWMKY